MSKFQVGDIIVANELSNSAYSMTTQKSGYEGRVIELLDKPNILGQDIRAEGLEGTTEGLELTLDSKYFDLKTPRDPQHAQVLAILGEEGAS